MDQPLPWPAIVRNAVLGALGVALAVTATLVLSQRPVVDLLIPGANQTTAPALSRDFPGQTLPAGWGHDGQFYYAIARTLPHLRPAAPLLDRPRYRSQRILLPLLGWILHPTGGGRGLVLSLAAVTVAGIAILCGAATALLATDGADPRWGLAIALLPGVFMSLRITCADALALGLALAGVALAARRHLWWASGVACAAVLARETTLLSLAPLGWFVGGGWSRSVLTRRPFDTPMVRVGAALVVAPAAAALIWYVVLRVVLAGTQFGVHEVAAPFIGLVHATRNWRILGTEETAPMVWAPIAAALLALRRRDVRSGRYGLALVIQLALLCIVAAPTLDYPQSATRTMLPLSVFAVLAWVLAATRREPHHRRTARGPAGPAPAVQV